AEVKIFLDAAPETRVMRRHQELVRHGIPAPLEQVAEDLARRDRRDRQRADSPLVPAPDAIRLDTSALTVEAQVAEGLKVVRGHPRFPGRVEDASGTAPGAGGKGL